MEQTKDKFWVLQTRINQIHHAGQGATDHDMQTLVSLASIANGEIRARKQADAAPDLLAVCVKMTNDGRFYKFNRDRVKYTCLACGGSGDSPRSIQHEKWCIINEAIAAIAKAKGDQCTA